MVLDVPGNTEKLAILLPHRLSKFSDVLMMHLGVNTMKKYVFSTIKGEDQQVIMLWSSDIY